MKLRLTENPKDWRNFTGAMGLMALMITGMLWWREKVPPVAFIWVGVPALLVFLTACAKPRWFRGFYRVGRTVFHHFGQFMGKVILIIFYLVILTPFGLVLKLSGKQFFSLRQPKDAATYWKPARKASSSDRMF